MTTQHPGIDLFIDTDIGVDDAVAIAWLLRHPAARIVGCTTVAGNTSVENATQNLLTLLDATACTVTVTMGAAAPLMVPGPQPGASALIHGPSGLWSAQRPHDLSGIGRDAPAAIAAAARANPGLTLLALGPLTNVALAVQRFPDDLAGVRLIALAGAKVGGNRTPVAEFNAFFDPHALAIVLDSGLDLTLVMLDAFSQLAVDSATFPQALAQQGDAAGQLLAAALTPYFAVQTQNAGGPALIPDAVAAIYALAPDLGEALPALVDVVTEGPARGQTIVGLDLKAKIPMIADDDELAALAARMFGEPGFDLTAAFGQILARRPDNARVVCAIQEQTMLRLLTQGLIA